MKKLIVVIAVFIATQIVPAQETVFTSEKKSAIVDNLAAAISHENTGLHTSGALVLADLLNDDYLESGDASKAVIPLLKLLRNGETEEERIAAALALYQLGDETGIYLLKGVGRFDENKKVASICMNLYYTYHKLNGTEYLINIL
jgi:HEAT repeat protein